MSDSKVSAAEQDKKTKEQQEKESFDFIIGYATREGWTMLIGMIFLVGATLNEIAMPLFIGKTIDCLYKEDFDAIGTMCVWMLVIILVSATKSYSIQSDFDISFVTVCGLLCRYESRHLQHSQRENRKKAS